MPYCPHCYKEYKEIYRLCPICKNEMLSTKPSMQARTDLSYSEIQIILDELNSKLSSNQISKMNYYIYPFKIRDDIIYDPNIVYNLQNISDNMCFYLGLLERPRLIYIEEGLDKFNNQKRVFTCDSNGTIHKYERERDFAGLYNGNFHSHSITIAYKRGYSFINLLGILAHEISHHFLRSFNIFKPVEKENEIFTDISAIYLGFGHLLYPAYKIISYNTDFTSNYNNSYSYVNHKRTIGYITPETILRAISLTCEIKNWNPKELLYNFKKGSDRSKISRKLLKYRIKLFKNKLSFVIVRIKTKRQESKIQKIVFYLERIKQKYEKIKNIMADTKIFKNKSISKDDGEFLVNLTNDIFTLTTEEEIKIITKKIKDSKVANKLLVKDVYIITQKLEKKINIWIDHLTKIIN